MSNKTDTALSLLSDIITKQDLEIKSLTDLNEENKAIIRMWQNGDKYRELEAKLTEAREEIERLREDRDSFRRCFRSEYEIKLDLEAKLEEAKDRIILLQRTCDGYGTEMRELKAKLARYEELLPDNFSESKDWKSGGVTERIEWLLFFHKQHKEEIARYEQAMPNFVGQKVKVFVMKEEGK